MDTFNSMSVLWSK